MGWSVGINRALIIPVFRFYISDLIDCTIYVNELKIKLLKSKFESCPVSSCHWVVADPVPWNSDEFLSHLPSELRVSFSPCCSYAEVSRVLFTLNFPIWCLEGQNLSSHNKAWIHLLTKKGNLLLEQGLINSDEEASSKKDRPRSSCSGKQENVISRPSGKNVMAFYDVAKVSGRFCNLGS